MISRRKVAELYAIRVKCKWCVPFTSGTTARPSEDTHGIYTIVQVSILPLCLLNKEEVEG